MPKIGHLAPVAFVFLAFAAPAGATPTTFTVDDAADNTASPSATTCPHPCNLYLAITASNNNPGTDTIDFASDISTITIQIPLPTISDPVAIDGRSGSSPHVELSGASGNSLQGLLVNAPSTTIEGLIINHFNSGAGITIADSQTFHPANDVIADDYIGTNATGTSCSDGSATGNAGGGILIGHGTGHRVGGTTTGERNVIACNTGAGVTAGANSSAATVEGNYIGLLADGTSGSAQATGVNVTGSGSIIGTTQAGGGNVISGNTGDGVLLLVSGGTPPNAIPIDGNRIGTDPSGTAARPNGGKGIDMTEDNAEVSHNVIAGNTGDGIYLVHTHLGTVADNNIGRGLPASGGPGTAAGGQNGPALPNSGSGLHAGTDTRNISVQRNVIANNSGDGALLDATGGSNTEDVDLTQNYFSSNGLLGIDMGGDGVTPNGQQPRTSSADLGENFPVLTSVATTGGHTTVQGTYTGADSHHYDIYFYPVSSCDPSGFGEGEATSFESEHVDIASGTTDVAFSHQLSYAIPGGSFVTATAVETGTFDVSEFSQCLRVPGATVVTTDPATAVTLDGATLNGTVNPDGVATSAHFEYGTTDSYGASTPDQPIGSDSTAHAISVGLTGLAAGTTFHYRVVATNVNGRVTAGADRTFTTASPAQPQSQTAGGGGPTPGSTVKAPACVVPKLKGKKLSAAKRALTKAHCKLGKVKKKHVRRKKRGTVLSQSPRAGTRKPAGTKVNLVLVK